MATQMIQAWQPWQRMTYEAMQYLGPVWSAVAAGFAIVLGGEVYITPSGEAYLNALDEEEAQ
jgi:hypothetical protein